MSQDVTIQLLGGFPNLNQALAGLPQLVKADVTGAVDGLRQVRARVTADNGVTCKQVLVLRGHEGEYRFVAPQSVLVKGGFLGVRMTAEDRHGNTVDSALTRVIPIG
ncbi:hypothetical protein [Streptomyces atratus]|uniref:hypothetical protein n=1 Tax=Streptomyces atratus TaxID=1893 RepID=UPI00225289A7|nr:hypothetical protein [Streptomyces atratus]MCX5345525.1 hypothetical protein [Streptomyces atratus]